MPIINKTVKLGRAPNFQIRLPATTVERVDEYREFLRNRHGFYPSFNECIRGLVDRALTNLGIGIKADEPKSNEEDSK